MSDDTMTNAPTGRPVLKHLAQVMATGVVLTILLFLIAGRLNWLNGWIFVAFWFALKIIYILVIGQRDQALARERSEAHADQKQWDRAVQAVYALCSVATIIVGALDGGRYRWSGGVPFGLAVVGLAIYIVMYALSCWAAATNTFHSHASRIQKDRGHEVITAGPYRYLRHPTYLATVLIWLATPPVLESWWALIPAALAGVMMALRTALEDRMLHDELPGYAAYAQQVRYRLLPGIW